MEPCPICTRPLGECRHCYPGDHTFDFIRLDEAQRRGLAPLPDFATYPIRCAVCGARPTEEEEPALRAALREGSE